MSLLTKMDVYSWYCTRETNLRMSQVVVLVTLSKQTWLNTMQRSHRDTKIMRVKVVVHRINLKWKHQHFSKMIENIKIHTMMVHVDVGNGSRIVSRLQVGVEIQLISQLVNLLVFTQSELSLGGTQLISNMNWTAAAQRFAIWYA